MAKQIKEGDDVFYIEDDVMDEIPKNKIICFGKVIATFNMCGHRMYGIFNKKKKTTTFYRNVWKTRKEAEEAK